MALKSMFPLQWKEIMEKVDREDMIADIDTVLIIILSNNQKQIVKM